MTSRRFIRLATVAGMVSTLLGLPSAASAQKSKCGPTSELTADLDFLVAFFSDTTHQELRREYSLATLGAVDPREVVTDSRTCAGLLGDTRATLRKAYGGKETPFNSLTFGFYRIGDYYIAMQVPDQPAGLVVSGYVEMLVFRVSDRSLVARLQV